jgi:hypothetical protein
MKDKGAIWLLSDGRSGSTWFAQLLNFHDDFHVEHEPIHRLFTPQLAGMPLMPLPSERTIDSTYLPLMQAIRDGSYRTNRFGPTPPGADGLIIRDIFALMIAPHILAKCDWLHPVLIVRHPRKSPNRSSRSTIGYGFRRSRAFWPTISCAPPSPPWPAASPEAKHPTSATCSAGRSATPISLPAWARDACPWCVIPATATGWPRRSTRSSPPLPPTTAPPPRLRRRL